MTLADETIAALRANHDRLAALVPTLTEAQLTGPSGAADWTVADVLSHLGSGAEIGRYPVLAAATGADEGRPENQQVWDRWNALAPADQATGFLEADEASVATFEALTPQQRDELMIDLGFLPQPVPLATALGMRLNEQTLHAWDVEVALDPAAALSDEAAALLARHFSETMTFLLGFVGKPGEYDGQARLALGEHTVVIADTVSIEPGTDDVTATFEGPLEAGVRMLSGRLTPEHTPAGTTIAGNLTLDDLRRVFPGF
jgi:uncharacterized protein (TIGR03083 family)